MRELEDISWFPPVLRDFQTDFIGFFVSTFHFYDVFISHLKNLSLPMKPMIDLCSGCGEPAISIFQNSNCFSSLSLTDKFPNQSNFRKDRFHGETRKVDVLEFDFAKESYYTMFNALHHFKDQDKVVIAHKVKSSGSTAFFVEILEPSIFCLLKVIFVATIGTLLLTPFLLPFSFKRVFFTYLLPINLLAITFDGVVSVFKSRSVGQYRSIFADFDRGVEVFQIKNGLSPLIVIQINLNK